MKYGRDYLARNNSWPFAGGSMGIRSTLVTAIAALFLCQAAQAAIVQLQYTSPINSSPSTAAFK